jgi:hypothetical protein
MPEIEVLRELAGLEPHERSWKRRQEKLSDLLTLFRGQSRTIRPGNDQVQQVLLALELVPILCHRPAKLVGLHSNRLERELFAGPRYRGIERGQEDPTVLPHEPNDGLDHLVATRALCRGWVSHSKARGIDSSKVREDGGTGGIRTHDPLITSTSFPGPLLRPLGHRSAPAPIMTVPRPRLPPQIRLLRMLPTPRTSGSPRTGPRLAPFGPPSTPSWRSSPCSRLRQSAQTRATSPGNPPACRESCC